MAARGISEVQDTEPYSLYLKSGVLYKVEKTFLEPSRSVRKSQCFFIGVQLIYSAVLVLVVQQSDEFIHILFQIHFPYRLLCSIE